MHRGETDLVNGRLAFYFASEWNKIGNELLNLRGVRFLEIELARPHSLSSAP